jgi:hypothetical protein
VVGRRERYAGSIVSGNQHPSYVNSGTTALHLLVGFKVLSR